MRNLKYPCIECRKSVRNNQKGLQCELCDKWVHLKCTDLTVSQFELLEINVEKPFYCKTCKPRTSYADEILESSLDLNDILHPRAYSSSLLKLAVILNFQMLTALILTMNLILSRILI